MLLVSTQDNPFFQLRRLPFVRSSLVKTIFYPTWTLAFGTQSVEPDNTLRCVFFKASRRNLIIIYLHWTHVFEWHAVWSVSQKGHQKKICPFTATKSTTGSLSLSLSLSKRQAMVNSSHVFLQDPHFNMKIPSCSNVR
jgi:hypothetical protein